jgi:CHAT domain-containing protein
LLERACFALCLSLFAPLTVAQAIRVDTESADCLVTVTTWGRSQAFVILRELGDDVVLHLANQPESVTSLRAQPFGWTAGRQSCSARVIATPTQVDESASDAWRFEGDAARQLAAAPKSGAAANERAAIAYENAARAWEALGDTRRAARAAVAAALVRLTKLQQYDRARATASHAYSQAISVGDERLLAIAARIAATGAANNHTSDQSANNMSADRWFERAFVHARRYGSAVETAFTLNEFGIAHYSAGDYAAATRWLETALRVARGRGVTGARILASHNLAYIRGERGEYALAIQRFNEARASISVQNDPGRYADITDNIARFLATLGQYDRALTEYQRARDIHAELGTAEGAATSEQGIALAYLSLGDTDSAVSHLQAALNRQGLPVESATARALHEALGTARLQRGDIGAARAAFHRAWGAKVSDAERLDHGIAMARLANASGDATGARKFAESVVALGHRASLTTRAAIAIEQARAARALRDVPGSLDPLTALSSELERYSVTALQVIVSSELAQSLLVAGRFVEAADVANRAIELMERTRDAVAAPSIRAEYAAARRAAYDTRVAALMLGSRDERAALEAANRSRSRYFVAQQSSAPTTYAELDSRLLRLEELRVDLGSNANLIRDIEAQIRALRLQLSLGTAANQSPVSKREPQDTSTKLLQSRLDTDTAVVFVSLEPQRGFVWTLTRDALQSREIPGDAVIAPLVKRLHQFAARAEPIAAEGGPAQQLGEWLLRDAFAARRPTKIVLCLDGSLHYVPVAALVAPNSASPSGARLIDVASVAVAGALRLRGPQQQRPTANTALFVQSDGASRASQPLSGAQREVADIGSFLGALPHRNLIGSAATAPAVRQALSQPVRWVHIASHGVANVTIPELSALELTPSQRTDGGDDSGKWFAGEIRSLGVDADLVVLSGCETQFGRQLSGEGLQGLSYAFLAAGADRALGSLWRVSDSATANLMTAFYRSLQRSGDPATALREAQLAVKEKQPHPYFWAGFVLTSRSVD